MMFQVFVVPYYVVSLLFLGNVEGSTTIATSYQEK